MLVGRGSTSRRCAWYFVPRTSNVLSKPCLDLVRHAGVLIPVEAQQDTPEWEADTGKADLKCDVDGHARHATHAQSRQRSIEVVCEGVLGGRVDEAIGTVRLLAGRGGSAKEVDRCTRLDAERRRKWGSEQHPVGHLSGAG